MSGAHPLLTHPLTYQIGWMLVNSLWQGAAVALALGLILLSLRRRSPNVRYFVSCIALVVMAVAPCGTSLAGFDSLSGDEGTSVEGTTTAVPSKYSDPRGVADTVDTPERSEPGLVRSSPGTPPFAVRAKVFLEPALPWLALGWLFGVIALSLRLLGSWIHLERLRYRHARPLTGKWQDVLLHVSKRMGVTRVVDLLESALVKTPIMFGWLRPVILLPVATLIGLTDKQLEALIAHELAHIRRGDYVFRVIQTVVENLFFFHPAVWWVSRQITIEREYCCDDLAAAACGDAVQYARALTDLAEIGVATPLLTLGASDGTLFTRVKRLLPASAQETSRRSVWLEGSVMIVAIVVAFAGAAHFSGTAAATDIPVPVNDPKSFTLAAAETGQSESTGEAASPAASLPADPASIGVALLEFSRVGSDAALSETSAQLYELVSERLANAPAVSLVDRAKLQRTIEELHLGQTGLTDPATAAEVGRIIGARILASCKLMRIDTDWIVTARLVNTETSEIVAARVSGKESDGLLHLADRVGDELVSRLQILGTEQTPGDAGEPFAREIATLRQKLAGRKLPIVTVAIPESHIGTWVPDPAGENEIIRVLSEVGYTVLDVSTLMKKQQSSWWLDLLRGAGAEREEASVELTAGFRDAGDILHNKKIAKIVEKTDVFIVGEAFSEYAGDNYGFKSCTARVEVKAIDTKSEAIAATASQHAVAAEVSELTAGKKALRTAGAELGLALARDIAAYWEQSLQERESLATAE